LDGPELLLAAQSAQNFTQDVVLAARRLRGEVIIPELSLRSGLGLALSLQRVAWRMPDLFPGEPRGFAGGGWLVDEPLFRFLVDFEIQKAQRLRYSISLVCFTAEPASSGNGESSPLGIAENITAHLRGTDTVALWTQGWLALLLIDAETSHLPSILARLTARLETIVWSAGGSCYPRTAVRAEDMLRQAADLLARAREEGGNRLYVAS
jgi:hypothetical protein